MSPGISTRLLATQSDERLLRLVREGHERAFEALVGRYRKPLLSYCRRMSLPEARVEDVLQQAFLKTWIALRDGAEVRDVKAWLYRVVHNAALNAVRDAAHDRDRIADPTLRVGAAPGDLERGLLVRETLAEVAALPPLQREVIVRTAVGGDSHEQVASDLGITGGAVRGLLYRARATLRTATTALTPPQLLAWLAGRADQGGTAAPERLGELAAGGGTVGMGGLLVKGTVAALTAGTILTGAAIVHLQEDTHRRGPAHTRSAPHRQAPLTASAAAGRSAATLAARSADPARRSRRRVARAGSRAARRASQDSAARHRLPGAGGGGSGAQRGADVVKHRTATDQPATSPGGSTQEVASTDVPTSSGTSAPVPAGAAGAGSGSGSSQGAPVGSAAGGSQPEGASGSSPAGSEQAPAAGGSSGGSTPSGSAPEGSGTGSGTGGAEHSAESGSSGGLVKTVVNEVGSVVEHLLH